MHPYMLFKCIHVIKSRFSKYLKIFIHFFSGKNVIRPEESLYVTSAAKYPGYHPEVKDEDWDVTDSSVGKRVHNIASASISKSHATLVSCSTCWSIAYSKSAHHNQRP